MVRGIGTRYWEVDGAGPEHPVVFVHGNPTSADDWLPFLESLEGKRRCLAPDLVGWGKAERPSDFSYTAESLAWFVVSFIDEIGVQRFDVVVHDWGGGAGLLAASWRAELVGRVVVMNAVPLTSEYRWHWIAQIWRRRPLGELMLATQNRIATDVILRQATPKGGSPPGVAEQVHRYLDGGTKRAILQLYRDADPEKLGELGRELYKLRCPGLVIWGDKDPYIDKRFGDWYGQALGGETRVEHLPDAGHWVWLDRPDAVDMAAAFLEAP
jgi:pimeloyl-ACP methyl ester carboxylesterase